MDIELAKVVFDDLHFLSESWNQDIDDASLRRASPILRSLLVDGNLTKIAKQAGRDLRVMAPAISKVEDVSALKQKRFYQSGGAKYKGMIVQSVAMVDRALSSEEIKANYELTKNLMGKSYPIKLAQFLKQVSFAINGVFVYRDEVVKYVANKLGGAHYDTSRKVSAGASTPTLEDKYVLLDEIRSGATVADKNAIYYELLSIGQRLVNSRDVRSFHKYLRQVIDKSDVICL